MFINNETRNMTQNIPRIAEPDWTDKASMFVDLISPGMTEGLRRKAVSALTVTFSAVFTQGSVAALEALSQSIGPVADSRPVTADH